MATKTADPTAVFTDAVIAGVKQGQEVAYNGITMWMEFAGKAFTMPELDSLPFVDQLPGPKAVSSPASASPRTCSARRRTSCSRSSTPSRRPRRPPDPRSGPGPPPPPAAAVPPPDRGTRCSPTLIPSPMTERPERDDQLHALGSFIRAQRQLANLSLRQMADLAQVSNPYLSQLERGLHEPSVRVLQSIARALNLSAETLLAHAGVARAADGDDRPHVDTEAPSAADPRSTTTRSRRCSASTAATSRPTRPTVATTGRPRQLRT